MFVNANSLCAKPNITIWKCSTLIQMKLIQSIRPSSHAQSYDTVSSPHTHTHQSGLLRSIHNESSSVARYLPPLLCYNICWRTPHRLHSISWIKCIFCCRTFEHSNIQKTTDYWHSPSISITKLFYDCVCNQNMSMVACCFAPMSEAERKSEGDSIIFFFFDLVVIGIMALHSTVVNM